MGFGPLGLGCWRHGPRQGVPQAPDLGSLLQEILLFLLGVLGCLSLCLSCCHLSLLLRCRSCLLSICMQAKHIWAPSTSDIQLPNLLILPIVASLLPCEVLGYLAFCFHAMTFPCHLNLLSICIHVTQADSRADNRHIHTCTRPVVPSTAVTEPEHKWQGPLALVQYLLLMYHFQSSQVSRSCSFLDHMRFCGPTAASQTLDARGWP